MRRRKEEEEEDLAYLGPPETSVGRVSFARGEKDGRRGEETPERRKFGVLLRRAEQSVAVVRDCYSTIRRGVTRRGVRLLSGVRALDTIEDDMAIDNAGKYRSF